MNLRICSEPMTKYAPTKADLKFRLAFSVAGLVMMVGAILYRGWPPGPAMIEILIIATAFFGGTAVWTIRKLTKGEYSDGL